jgi:hypothetical protein
MTKFASLLVLLLGVSLLAGCPCPDHSDHKEGKYPIDSFVRVTKTGDKAQVMSYDCRNKIYSVVIQQTDGDTKKERFYDIGIGPWVEAPKIIYVPAPVAPVAPAPVVPVAPKEVTPTRPASWDAMPTYRREQIEREERNRRRN